MAGIVGEHYWSIRSNCHGIFISNAPRSSVKATISHRNHNIGNKRSRCFLTVKKSVSGRERGFLKLEAQAMNGRPEDMRTMPRLFEDPVHRLLEIHHCDPSLGFANGGLKLLHTDHKQSAVQPLACPADVRPSRAVAVDYRMKVYHDKIAVCSLRKVGTP